MANTIKLSIKVDDDGSLSIVGKNAKDASEKLDDVAKSSDKAGKSSKTLDRNLKGTANMTSNGTKQFAKMSQGITGGLVPAYAVLASNVFALSAAFNFLKRAADVQILEKSQVQFAQNSGVALRSITKRLREASDGMLGFQEAGQAAAIGLAKGFSPTQLEALAEGARKASTALGRDFQDSFDRLVRGASKAEPELLDELGITLRLEEATQKYAEAIGKNRDELNTYQRSQAVLIETQRQLNKNFGDFEAATNPFVKLSKTFEDLIKQVTQFFLPIFTGFAEIVNRSAVAAVAVFGGLAAVILKAIIPMDGFNERIAKMGEESSESFKKAKQGFEDYKKGIKEAAKAVVQSKAMGAKGVQSGAQAMVDSGSTNKTLQKAASGGVLSGLDKNNISKALKSAEKQFKEHGQIRTGIFKGMNIKMVRDFGKSMDMMNARGAGAFKRIGQVGVASAKTLGLAFKGAAVIATGSIQLISGAVSKLTSGLGKLMRFASGIGIALMFVEMFNTIRENGFSILLSFAKVLDKIIGFIAPFVNKFVKGFLELVDRVKNAFTSMRNGIAEIINKIATGIRDTFNDAVNSVKNGINILGTAINSIAGKKLIKPLTIVEDKQPLVLMKTSTAVSTLAADYKGLNAESTTFEDKLRSGQGIIGGLGKLAFEYQNTTASSRASKEALKSYNDLLKTGEQELSDIIEAQGYEDDALKRNRMGFEALQSIDIPGLYEKISQKSSKIVEGLDGTKKKVENYVMSEEARAEALENLKIMLADVVKVSPVFGKALEGATLKADGGLEKLKIRLADTVANLKEFENGLSDVKNTVVESLSGSDVTAAYFALLQFREAGIAAGKGIAEFTGDKTGKALADITTKLKEMFGKDIDGEKLFEDLTKLKVARDALAIQQESANLLSGKTAEIIQSEIAVRAIRLQIEEKELALSVARGKEEKDRLKTELARLRLQQPGLEQKSRKAVLTAGTEFGMPNTANFIDQQNNARILGEALAKLQTEYNAMSEAEKEAAEGELLKAKLNAYGAAAISAATAMKDLGASFKALGPDGELMGSLLDGIGNITGSLGTFMQQMASDTLDLADTIQAGLGVLSSVIGAMSSMMAASSKERIRQIDNEIAMEKKRDGKSKESVGKIASLEKKKDAESRKAFEREKKMKMAQVVIATAMGAMQAYASAAFLPPPANVIVGGMLAGLVVAMGAKQLSMIASSSYQGGGNVGAATPGSISVGKRRDTVDLAKSQSASGELAYMRGERGMGGPENFRPAFTGYKNRNYGGNTGFMVGEQGPELFVPDRPGTIVPADDTAQMGGAVTANINITALDASGVEEVLIEQQGNIIGMIREAANSYGQDFLEGVDETIYTSPQARRA